MIRETNIEIKSKEFEEYLNELPIYELKYINEIFFDLQDKEKDNSQKIKYQLIRKCLPLLIYILNNRYPDFNKREAKEQLFITFVLLEESLKNDNSDIIEVIKRAKENYEINSVTSKKVNDEAVNFLSGEIEIQRRCKAVKIKRKNFFDFDNK